MSNGKHEIPQTCYAYLEAGARGQRIGLVKRGQNGFLITDIDRPDMDEREVRMMVNALNTARGVTPELAARMVAMAVSGWRPCHDARVAA